MRLLYLYTLSCITAISITACTKLEDSNLNTLNLNMHIEPSVFDSRKTSDMSSACFQFLINEGLIKSTPNSSSVPGIAESYFFDESGSIVTFQLRDAYWSDGKKITAFDFEETWKQALSPLFPCANTHLYYTIKNARRAKAGKCAIDEVGIKAIDDMTLQVTLEAPAPYFTQTTSFCTLFATPPCFRNKGVTYTAQPGDKGFVCNGPYRIKSYTRGVKLLLEKNPFYYNHDSIQLEAISISFLPDNTTTFELFKNGEVDLIGLPFSDIPVDFIESLNKKKPLKYQSFAGTTFCSLNTRIPPFTSKNVRKAFYYAINREEILQALSKPLQNVAYGIIPPALLLGGEKKQTTLKNKTKAKAFLKKST